MVGLPPRVLLGRALLASLVVLRSADGLSLPSAANAVSPTAHSAAAARAAAAADPSTLAGDPSLVLNTNVAIADKSAFMKAASAAVAASLSKPESYVAVCVTDGLDLLFGGSDAPCAVGCVYSIGQINQENNAVRTPGARTYGAHPPPQSRAIQRARAIAPLADRRSRRPSLSCSSPMAACPTTEQQNLPQLLRRAAGKLRLVGPHVCRLRRRGSPWPWHARAYGKCKHA